MMRGVIKNSTFDSMSALLSDWERKFENAGIWMFIFETEDVLLPHSGEKRGKLEVDGRLTLPSEPDSDSPWGERISERLKCG